jgi:ribose/xylose/arabinose/galactoside ABC-type transport system permease subunit
MSLRSVIASSPAYLSVLVCLFSIVYLLVTKLPRHPKEKMKKLAPKFQYFDTVTRRWIFLIMIFGCFFGLLASLAYGSYTAFPIVLPLSALVIFDGIMSLVTNIYSVGWGNYVYDKAQKLKWLGYTEIGLAVVNILYCCFIYFVYLK